MADRSTTTRRAALGFIATGAVLTGMDTFGFSSVSGTRTVSVDTATDPDALIGLLVVDQIKKNQREQLVTVTNTTSERLSVTVDSSDCDPNRDTFYAPDGTSGCRVAFTLEPSGVDGDSKVVDLKSSRDGETIPFTITATSPSLSFEATRSTSVVSGNTAGAVEITKLKQFRANRHENNWTIREIEVVSNDASHELERVEYEVRSDGGAGELVGRFEESASGNEYVRTGSKQNPALVIEPDDSHVLEKNAQYGLTVTAYDNGGNFASVTDTDNA